MRPRSLCTETAALLSLTAVAAMLFVSCASETFTPLPITPYTATDPKLRTYLPADTPANVITNLETAYAKRDIEAYAALFAPEFTFRFQPQDAELTGEEAWDLESELESTRNMFHSGKVKELEIRLEIEPAVPSSESGPEHTTLVVVSHTFLKITQYNGRIHQVKGDRQEFYLRRAFEDEDRDGWLIVEWRDMPE